MQHPLPRVHNACSVDVCCQVRVKCIHAPQAPDVQGARHVIFRSMLHGCVQVAVVVGAAAAVLQGVMGSSRGACSCMVEVRFRSVSITGHLQCDVQSCIPAGMSTCCALFAPILLLARPFLCTSCTLFCLRGFTGDAADAVLRRFASTVCTSPAGLAASDGGVQLGLLYTGMWSDWHGLTAGMEASGGLAGIAAGPELPLVQVG